MGTTTVDERTHPPVVEIGSFPIRIVSRIKSAAIHVELITEDQFPVFTLVIIRRMCVCVFRGVLINQAPVSRDQRDLARGIRAANIEHAESGEVMCSEVGNNGPTGAAYRTALQLPC